LDIKKVTVVGSGQMGHGIAEVFALSNYQVFLEDAFEDALKKAQKSIEASIDRLVKSGKIKQENSAAILSNIRYSSNLEESVTGSDLIIEAVPEIMDLKKDLLSKISGYSKPDAIIATNTSNFRITDLSKSVKNPERFLGLHFFNPPVLLKLVEVIKGETTSGKVFDDAFALMGKIGKTAIRVFKDSPGFVVNRINAPESLLFCIILDKKIASPEAVDRFAKSQGLPMGPYELMDYVGIDTVVHSLEYYAEALSPEYGKCQAFREKFNRKELGLKTGKGFYEWENGKARIPDVPPTDQLELLDVLAVEINEASKVVEEQIALPDDIETGVKLGMNRPFGPISVASGLTSAEIRKKLEQIHERFGSDVFAPTKSIREGTLRELFSRKEFQKTVQERPQVQSSANSIAGSAGSKVLLEKRGKVSIITIRNQRLNLIDAQVLQELEKAVDEVADERETLAVIVRGSGGVFSAGAELSQFFNGSKDFMEFSRKGQKIFKKIQESPKIFIAQIESYALGGGFELSLSCDIRFSTDDALLGFPEVQRGILPGWSGTQRLARLVGISRAEYLILSSERITGKQAADYGLVSKVFSKASIEDETLKFATKFCDETAPISAYLSKVSVNRGYDGSMDEGLWIEALSMGVLFSTDDIKEGVSAFIQKRKPEFQGK
jgi:enoyl-CoA hydratase/3-hydroxyacyl-CoA dehydrogenase